MAGSTPAIPSPAACARDFVASVRKRDALAGLKPRLLEDVKKLPGARLLDGRYTAVQQSMAVRRDRPAAAAYLAAFAEEIKSSGLLRAAIDKHGAHGLTIEAVAPAATP